MNEGGSYVPARTPAFRPTGIAGVSSPAASPGAPPPGQLPGGPPPAGSAPGGPAEGQAPQPDTHSDAMAVKAVRQPGHLGLLSVTQLVVAEAAVLIAAAVATRGLVPALIAGLAAAVVLGVFFARRNRRWWVEDLLIAWRHRRRRSAARDTGVNAVLTALRSVAPGLAVRDVSAPDGARVGVARDEAGWFTVVALDPTAPVHQEAAPIPLDTLVSVLSATEQPGVVLQLVTHTVPAPGPELHPASPAGSSYRQLVDSLSRIGVPAHRESTVSVRLDARSFAEAVLDHTADPETAAALVASLGRRVATSLRRLGVTCRVLNSDDLIATLARSCDVESGVLGDASQVREDWTRWHSARLTHRTYWLKTWPGSAAQIGTLFEWAAAIRAAHTSVALTLDPSGRDDIAVRAFLRFAAGPDDDFAALEKVLFEGVRSFGAELLPLDGEQGPAAYATAPTGGGAG